MNNNPYLRAYMAGITVPTVLLVVAVSALSLLRVMSHASLPLEPALIFPVAIVPNLFGLWNMLYVKLYSSWHHRIGFQGAVLPFLVLPIGFVFASAAGIARIQSGSIVYFDMYWIPLRYLVIAPFIAMVVYYLVWKYLVGYLNRVLELPA